MTPHESQLAMLPIYFLILGALALALVAVWADLRRTLRQRLHEDSAKLLFLVAVAALALHAAPARAEHRWSQARIERIVRATFPDDQTRALCISDHESDGTPNHWNPAGQNGSNTGLFQVDERTWDWRMRSGSGVAAAIAVVGRVNWSRMHDPAYNARVARRIWLWDRARGNSPWNQWSTRRGCGG